jgi:hypothetical protein
MTSIFFDTIAKAISDYRLLLRRYLSQADRQHKLAELNLKDPGNFRNDLALYKTARAIIADIEQNMKIPEQGYYSYSGIAMFAEYLTEFLDNYEIDGNEVVHRAQRASKALIQAIQLVNLPENRLNQSIAEKLAACNEVIASYGSEEQRMLHQNNLERQRMLNESFYLPILENYQEKLAVGVE